MVFPEQQQLADHTSQLSEETSRDVTVDLYADVKEVHQDTSITTKTDSVTENCNSHQMIGNWTNSKHLIMTFSIHSGWRYATMNCLRTILDLNSSQSA